MTTDLDAGDELRPLAGTEAAAAHPRIAVVIRGVSRRHCVDMTSPSATDLGVPDNNVRPSRREGTGWSANVMQRAQSRYRTLRFSANARATELGFIEEYHVFNKQHLGAVRRDSLGLSRRTLVLAGIGYVAWGRSLNSRVAAGCAISPTTSTLRTGPRTPPIANIADYWQLKDPCVVADGSTWHLYGTGWKIGGTAPIVFHARANSATGPFTMGPPSTLHGVSGGGVAAPGVVFEDGIFHLFVQTEFQAIGGAIEHLVSTDGDSFVRADTAIPADITSGEAMVYDAQPCVLGGQRYLAYAAAPRPSHTELHLARSAAAWSGPWTRLGPIVRQSEVAFQNPIGCAGYEWGLEGPQLVALPSGQVLLLGVCFLAGHEKGRRQRVFVAIASAPEGPYDVLGTPFDPQFDTWATGENGHPGAALVGDSIMVVYQRRSGAGRPWTLDTATIQLGSLRS